MLTDADQDASEGAIVDVDDAWPADREWIDAQLVAAEEVVVEERGAKVVGRSDGVQVAREVEVDVLHRHDLAVPATGPATLHAEHRSERGLADGSGGAHPDAV